MNAQEIHARIDQSCPATVTDRDLSAIDPWIEVKPDALPAVCRFLRDEQDLRFDMLHCITVVDFFETDEKKTSQPDYRPHLDVIYHLSSMVHRHRIVLKVQLPRWKNDAPGELPDLATVSDVWRTAEWHEREVFDLSGVRFVGNRDLRRILCPEDWPGHPLRKDFVMPDQYHGIPAR